MRRLLPFALVIFGAAQARAEAPATDDKVDFMHVLAQRGLHDLEDERYNAYGQISLIGHGKAPFSAAYTNLGGSPKSLLPTAEGSYTATATLFLGARLWHGAEAYVVPEIIASRALSELSGLGSTIQNAELQKNGGPIPTPYLARVYLRQTFGLGGARVKKESQAMQLGGAVDARRLVITLGRFSVVDFLDKNAYAGDLRRQFINMAFMTHAAYDFSADARGYTWGGVLELYFDDWAVRAAHVAVPEQPNQLAVDYRFWKYFGDQVEIEHTHEIKGQPGAIRLLGYLNRENMGRFDEAVAAHRADPSKNAATCATELYGSQNAAAPDLCWARRPNLKLGLGLNLEQAIGSNLGFFLRAMYADGQTEVYSFTSTDRSLSFGLLSKGTWWRRAADTAGVAFGLGWISKEHAAYLGQGGIDGFIGDGKNNHAAESVIEVFYSLAVLKPLWLTADYQHVTNPAYNADRGPVDIFGGRLHAEF